MTVDQDMQVPQEIVFSAAASGSQDARLLLDQMDPIGPCEYCSFGLKGHSGHLFGCPRFDDGEIPGSAIYQAKCAFVRGEIDARELEKRVRQALERSLVALAGEADV